MAPLRSCGVVGIFPLLRASTRWNFLLPGTLLIQRMVGHPGFFALPLTVLRVAMFPPLSGFSRVDC
jgi:hypothetical protein